MTNDVGIILRTTCPAGKATLMPHASLAAQLRVVPPFFFIAAPRRSPRFEVAPVGSILEWEYHEEDQVAVKKFALSVPEDVMKQVDRAAKRFGVTRSRFIADVLRKIANAGMDAEITRRVDELFADPEIAGEQSRTAASLSPSPGNGTEW